MKRFLLFSISLFLVIILVLTNLERFDDHRKKYTSTAKVVNEQIEINGKPTDIIGMNISDGWPGDELSSSGITKDKYLQWFKEISAMHVNCLRVADVMPNIFYEALEEYNDQHYKKPLYLLQSIPITNASLKKQIDQGQKLDDDMVETIHKVVDVVHGDYSPFVNVSEDKIYRSDVSDYVIGFNFSNDLSYGDYLYGEVMFDATSYQGKYIKTAKGASVIEAYLAKIADKLMDYEYDTYYKQSMISISGSMDDVYDSVGKSIDPKGKRFFDINYIKPGAKNQVGIFASYNIAINYSEKITPETLERTLKKLNDYHPYPIVITEFGIPTSRISNDYMLANDRKTYSEQEQGKAIIALDKAIRKAGCSGGFIYEFTDDWFAKSSNMPNVYRDKIDNKYLSQNIDSTNQNFGIKNFVASNNNGVGDNISDWSVDMEVSENDDMQLNVKETYEGLSLLVQLNDNVLDDDKLVVGFDINPNIGTNKMGDYKFSNPVEFVMELDQKSGKISVNEYYDRFIFDNMKDELVKNPSEIPVKESNEFNVETIKLKDRYFDAKQQKFIEEQDYDYGILTKGDEVDDSNADYFIGENYFEVTIPWDMLNFVRPDKHLIYDDFYDGDDDMTMKIKSINLDVELIRDKETYQLKNSKFKLKDWNSVDVVDNFKDSYDELSEYYEEEVCQ